MKKKLWWIILLPFAILVYPILYSLGFMFGFFYTPFQDGVNEAIKFTKTKYKDL